MMSRVQRKYDVLSVCSAVIATFISDYEYEIEYEYEFSNRTYLPPIITYQKNLIPKGGEVRDTKTLNLSRNIVSLQGFVDVSRF